MTEVPTAWSCTVFSNMLKDTQLHNLADADEHEIVQQVQVLKVFSNMVK